MRAGALDHPVNIEVRGEIGRNDLNEPQYSWSLWRENVFAEIIARRGAEQFDAETKQRYLKTYFKFRFRFADVDGIQSTMRLTFEGRVYDIKNIQPDYTKRDETIVEVTLQDDQ